MCMYVRRCSASLWCGWVVKQKWRSFEPLLSAGSVMNRPRRCTSAEHQHHKPWKTSESNKNITYSRALLHILSGVSRHRHGIAAMVSGATSLAMARRSSRFRRALKNGFNNFTCAPKTMCFINKMRASSPACTRLPLAAARGIGANELAGESQKNQANRREPTGDRTAATYHVFLCSLKRNKKNNFELDAAWHHASCLASHRIARERGGGKLMCDDSLRVGMSCYPELTNQDWWDQSGQCGQPIIF